MKFMAIASAVLGGGILTNAGGFVAYQATRLTPEEIEALKAEEARLALPEEYRDAIPKGTPLKDHGRYIDYYKGWKSIQEYKKKHGLL